MKGFTYWPPSDQDAGNFVRKEKLIDRSWPKYSIEILRYYGKRILKSLELWWAFINLFYYPNVCLLHFIIDLYLKARTAVRGFVAEGSAYETEKETGRGKRKKVWNRFFDSDFDKEIIRRNNKKSFQHRQVFLSNASVKIQYKTQKMSSVIVFFQWFPSSKVSLNVYNEY